MNNQIVPEYKGELMNFSINKLPPGKITMIAGNSDGFSFMNSKITDVAIKLNGVILTSEKVYSHYDLIEKLYRKNIISKEDYLDCKNKIERGYLVKNENGISRFVDRSLAARIAKHSGQLKEDVDPSYVFVLHSNLIDWTV